MRENYNSQMSITDMVRASSLDSENNSVLISETMTDEELTEATESANNNDAPEADLASANEAPDNEDALNNDSTSPDEGAENDTALPIESVAENGASEDKPKADKKKSRRKRKAELTPDEKEKEILRLISKKDAEKIALESELITVRKEKSADDLKNINKICSDKGIPLSDLIDFLKHLKNSDTLKMLKSEISVRSKTVKKEAPPAGKTG